MQSFDVLTRLLCPSMCPVLSDEVRKERKKETKHDTTIELAALLHEVRYTNRLLDMLQHAGLQYHETLAACMWPLIC
jgi:hypothetical protein